MIVAPLARDTAFLDGLRGLAALVVSCWHHEKMFYLDHPKGEDLVVLVYRRWSGLALNGPFMVSVFFVLSGRVLADAFYRDPNSNNLDRLRSSIIRRPLRLGLPVLGFYLIIFLIYRIPHLPNFNDDWDAFAKLHELNSAAVWQMNCHDFAISSIWFNILGAVDVAVGKNNITCSSLWTIGEEFCGSYLIFALATFGPRYRRAAPLFMLFLIACFTWRPSYLAQFTAGVLTCHIHHAGWTHILFTRDPATHFWPFRLGIRVLRWTALAFLIYIGMMNWGLANREIGIDELYFRHLNWTHFGYEDYGCQDVIREVLAACCIIVWMENCAPARKIFGSRFFSYMGKLSFGYYLWHGWVFGNVGAWIVMRLEKNAPTVIPVGEWAVDVWAVTLPINIFLTALVAHYFRKVVDKPSTVAGRVLLRILDKPPDRPTISDVKAGVKQSFIFLRNHWIFVRVLGAPSTVQVNYSVLPQSLDIDHACEMEELESSNGSIEEKNRLDSILVEDVKVPRLD